MQPNPGLAHIVRGRMGAITLIGQSECSGLRTVSWGVLMVIVAA